MTDLGLYNRRGRVIATRPLHITSFIGVWNLSQNVCLVLSPKCLFEFIPNRLFGFIPNRLPGIISSWPLE